MKKTLREFTAILLALTLLLCICSAAASLIIPPRISFGLNWKSYAMEERDSIDVIYLGSSITYCGVSPALIYKHTGLSGYVVAGPEQTITASYYYLKQALKTQSPKAVVLELNGMYNNYFGVYADSNISYMPFGLVKLEAIFSALRPQARLEILFPILAYHDRCYTFSIDDIKANLQREQDIYAGYSVLTYVGDPGDRVTRLTFVNEYYEREVEYLGKIKAFCDEQGIALYVYLSPALASIEDESLSSLEEDLLSLKIDNYCDFSHGEAFSSLGLLKERDWADSTHLNLSGTLKFNRALAEFIGDTEPSGRADAQLWQQRVQAVKDLEVYIQK